MQALKKITEHSSLDRKIIWTLAVLFIASGLFKFSGQPLLSEVFVRWGYPDWFVYFAGGIELIGGLMLLKPKTLFYGALLLAWQMFGAAFTHVLHAEAFLSFLPLALMVILIQIAHHYSQPIVKQVARLLNWDAVDYKRP
jgi:putative oxidoreductase